MSKIKISIITISYNNEQDIRPTIESVVNQNYPNIEYIIVDGGSKDNTLKIIKEYEDKISIIISETDDGMYDAINKGIKLATGKVVGLIHSGDRLYNNMVIDKIAGAFNYSDTQAVYGYSKIVNTSNKLKFLNISPRFSKYIVRLGWMPSHQSIYVRKENFEKYGYYRNDLGGSGDYELFLRFFYVNSVNLERLTEFILFFTLGGRSTKSLKVQFASQTVHRKCWELNGQSPPKFVVIFKIVRKIIQYLMAKIFILIQK